MSCGQGGLLPLNQQQTADQQQATGNARQGDGLLRQPEQAVVVDDDRGDQLARYAGSQQVGRADVGNQNQDGGDKNDAEEASGKQVPRRRSAVRPGGNAGGGNQQNHDQRDRSSGERNQRGQKWILQDLAEASVDDRLQRNHTGGDGGKQHEEKRFHGCRLVFWRGRE